MASRPYWQTRRQAPSAKKSVPPAPSDGSDLRTTAVNGVDNPTPKGASEGRREEARLLVKQVLAECQSHELLLQPEGPPQGDGFIGLFIEVSRWQADWRSENARRRGSKSLFACRISYQRPLDTLKIGEGTTFAVYRRYDNGSVLAREPKLVVMKDSKIRFKSDGAAKDMAIMSGLLAEIRVLSQGSLRRHANIVKLLDIRWDHPNLDRENLGPTLYLEYAELGTLTDFCASGNRQRVDMSTVRSILMKIWDGLDALHGCGIVHGDVKPSNVLLFLEGTNIIAKISDFGCAVFIAELKAEKVELTGRSPPWDAPEAGSEIQSHLLLKTDIYSYGLLYWWFQLGGQDPFSIDSNEINNAFGLSGPRESKLDALKKLKQTEDLDGRMLRSVISVQNEKDMQLSGFRDEVKLIGSLTLRKKPEERTLGVTSHPFTKTLIKPKERNTSGSSSSGALQWTLESAWRLPLRQDPDEKIPSRRLVQLLKDFKSGNSGSIVNQADINVLLFRCYLEGFGVPHNSILAVRYLQDAADLGHSSAQAIAKRFCDVIGYEELSDQAKMDTLMYELAMEERLPTLTMNKMMPSQEELLCQSSLSPLAREWLGQQLPLIHYIAARGWLKVMQLLLETLDPNSCNAQMDLHDEEGYTPLMCACKYGHSLMVSLLLDRCSTSGIIPGHSAPPPLFLLPNLSRPIVGKQNLLKDIIGKLVSAGADPNQVVGVDVRETLVLGELTSARAEDLAFHNFRDPLSYAIWVGDFDIVECLLGIGAVPDLICLHLAAAAHRVDMLEAMFNCKTTTWPATGQCNLGDTTLLDSALLDSPLFGYSKRLVGTRMTHEVSLKHIVRYLLDRCTTASRLMTPRNMLFYLHQCCRFGVVDVELLQWIIYPKTHGPYETAGEEFLFTAISWDQFAIVKYLLDINCRQQNFGGFGAPHVCAIWTVAPEIYHHLQACGIGFGSKQNNRAATDLETPLQMAVACQNFPIANWLFENGRSRDEVIESSTDRREDCTLLGWLIRRNWSETQASIFYLLEEYVDAPLPNFIVTPPVGRSALQEAARSAPISKLGEQDARDQMQYLVLKYPGSRHLEYQRIDNAQQVRGDTQHAGLIHTIVDGKPTVVKNAYHFTNYVVDYPETKEKENNGTALHFAVRSINFPAVEALLEAGADGSAMIGLPLPDSINVTRKPGSTYAVKENCWASTVLDFAMLVADRLQKDSIALSSDLVTGELRAKYRYQEQRIQDIIKLLQKKGAANSVTFVGKRSEEKIYRERREKGNRAAFRMFKKDVKDGFSAAWKIGKATKKEVIEQLSTPMLTPEGTKMNFANRLLRECRFDEALKIYLEVQEDFKKKPFYTGHSDYWLLVMNIAVTYSSQSKYVEAEQAYAEAIIGLEGCLGTDHPTTLTARHNLGVCFLHQKKTEEAESWCNIAYTGRKKVLGPKNRDTLEALKSIGLLRMLQDRNVEAEVAYEQALRELEAQTHSPDSQKLRVMYNLGLLYQKTQRLDDAKKILDKTVAGRESTLGVHHMDTLHAVAQLFLTLKALGETEGAIALGQRALTGYQEIFETEDANVTNTAYSLGEIYRDLQQWDEAIAEFQLTLQGEEKRLGRDHSSTLVTVTKLASTYNLQDRIGMAIEMEIRALGGYQEKFDFDNTNVTNTAYRLGELYLKLKEWDKSSSMYRLALKGEESRLGLDHTDTLLTVGRLAANYASQDLNEKAIELETRLLLGYQKQFPFDNERLTNTAYRVAKLYAKLKQWDLSISMFEMALRGEQARLGPDDEGTLITMRQLALAYTSQGSAEKAIQLRIRVLDSMKKATAIDDRLLLDTHWNLGLNYRSTNLKASRSQFKTATEGYEVLLGLNDKETLDGYLKLGEISQEMCDLVSSELYFRKAMEGFTRTLGSDHKDTLRVIDQVAALLYEADRRTEGIRLYEDALASRKRTLGPEHLDTIMTMKKY